MTKHLTLRFTPRGVDWLDEDLIVQVADVMRTVSVSNAGMAGELAKRYGHPFTKGMIAGLFNREQVVDLLKHELGGDADELLLKRSSNQPSHKKPAEKPVQAEAPKKPTPKKTTRPTASLPVRQAPAIPVYVAPPKPVESPVSEGQKRVPTEREQEESDAILAYLASIGSQKARYRGQH